MDASTVRAIVAQALGGSDATTASAIRVRREHGGCSDTGCFRVDLVSQQQSVFVKVSDNDALCETEAHGLRALAATNTIRVPRVLAVGRHGNFAFLITEYIAMGSRKSDYAALGTALGKLHASPQPASDDGELFGFDIDNFIGATLQKNTPKERDWITFFKRHRLQFQLDLLRDRGICKDKCLSQRVEHVIEGVKSFFDPDEKIRPSLLHGDLWQGNWGFTLDKEPVIFDPACYWGHSEAELAMMTLFGYLPQAFFTAYEAEMPRAKRCDDRVPLYQLYHALNHYNLFGGEYQSLCEDLLTQLEKTLSRKHRLASGA